MRRRRPARFASSAISRAERLTPAVFSSSSAARVDFLDAAAGLLGRLQQPPPGRRRALPGDRRVGAALGLGAQRAASVLEQGPGQVEVAGGETGGGRDLVGIAVAGELGLDASAGSGANSTVWQREVTVSSSAAGSELSRIRWTNSGGSSSVFSSAFWLSSRIASADSSDEDAAAALERAVGGGADHPLAHLLDHVLGAARRQPDEVGVGRGVEQRPTAGLVGVVGARRRGSRPQRRAPRPACRRPAAR